MRFDKSKAFPYPVLRPYSDDYVDVEFQVTVDFTVEGNTVAVEVSFALSSEEIHETIQSGKAKYVAVISCRDTYFRQTLVGTLPSIQKQLSATELRGEVRVDSYIVAAQYIHSFHSPDINPEFGRETFHFSPGEVLAQDEPQVFYIDRDLFRPVSSVFELVKNDALSGGEWKVRLDDGHVQIEVSPQMKETIDRARNNKKNQIILINSVYFGAVTHAIQKLQEDRSSFEDYTWARVILQQLHNNGTEIDSHDAYILAQRLLKEPLKLLHTYCFAEDN